ncbi:hypothetical protein [Labrenzia sp. DG1229]|uniref:hypothetical protein n=1 Tax=Labrenzia sp. DG1229 TaxID=681847 RepID=UPI0004919680|nr:hypothetical protein [Labrenzia sp. DG1229]
MQRLAKAKCHTEKGIEGDRYFSDTGNFSPIPDAGDIPLMASETLRMVHDVHVEVIAEVE